MPDDRLSAIAERLLAARRQGTRIALDGPELPADFEEGFAIQEKVVAGLASPIIGWKVMAVPQGPVIFAPILGADEVKDGGAWDVAGPEPAGIELEIAFRIGRDVAAGATEQQVLAAVESAHVVFELCQSRLTDPGKHPRHVVLADCISNAGLVVGSQILNWRSEHLADRAGRLLVDGRVHVEGRSVDPVAALLMLPPALAARGKMLTAGQIVITGSLIGMNWLTGHHALEGSIDGLGRVSLDLAAA
ncbi:MAG TPA: hypothetical protein VJ740_02400 [Hyphomicrobiaceae bacterium]|nr:hypothetical protein [Hyphomicrobiaceae bacterium]